MLLIQMVMCRSHASKTTQERPFIRPMRTLLSSFGLPLSQQSSGDWGVRRSEESSMGTSHMALWRPHVYVA